MIHILLFIIIKTVLSCTNVTTLNETFTLSSNEFKIVNYTEANNSDLCTYYLVINSDCEGYNNTYEGDCMGIIYDSQVTFYSLNETDNCYFTFDFLINECYTLNPNPSPYPSPSPSLSPYPSPESDIPDGVYIFIWILAAVIFIIGIIISIIFIPNRRRDVVTNIEPQTTINNTDKTTKKKSQCNDDSYIELDENI